MMRCLVFQEMQALHLTLLSLSSGCCNVHKLLCKQVHCGTMATARW